MVATPPVEQEPAPDIEEGLRLSPRFDAAGLVTAVVTDAASGDVLMVAHMNAEALARTIETGSAHYWSRSRRRLWHKGETSGHTQKVVELRIDCDQDAVWLRVETAGTGANCHTGRRSCFYRAVSLGQPQGLAADLRRVDETRLFDPAKVYSHDV